MRPIALITGASAGIGKELAKLFAAGGYDLVLTARRVEELRTLADELVAAHGISADVFPADLADPAAPQKLFDTVLAAGLTIEVLVNNAGFGLHGPVVEQDSNRLLAMIQVNVTSLVHLTRLFAPDMVQRGQGKILNVASIAAFQPGPLMAGYYASKAFVLSFSEAMSEELRGTGVTVTCLCPGPTRTEFATAADMDGAALFRTPNTMDVEPVARAGFRATQRGRRVVIPGFLNKILTTLVMFVPHGLLLRMVRRLQESRKPGNPGSPGGST